MKNKSGLKNYHSKPIFEELEPRQLFSAGVESLLVNQLEDPNATYVNVESAPAPSTENQPQDTFINDIENKTNEIVFIDTCVNDYQGLLDDITNNDSASRNIEIVLLDADQDGISQISKILSERDNLDAIHIISHGSDGSLDLGNSQLNFNSLILNHQDISAWGNAFSENGDILLYGCNVAETQFGQSFVDYLADITGTDIAASDDATGNSASAGDWMLEYQSGTIEAEALLNTEVQTQWEGVLAVTANFTSSAQTSNLGVTGNKLTWSHTVNEGVNRVLFVETVVSTTGTQVQSVTFGGIALTKIGSSSGNHPIEIWVLVNPTVSTNDIVVTYSASGAAAAGATTYNGVNQTTAYSSFTSASGSGTTATVNVTSATGDLVMDTQYWANTGANLVGANQASKWTQTVTGVMKTGSTTEAGASTVIMTGTSSVSSDWEIAALNIKAAANSAPVLTSSTGTLSYPENSGPYLIGSTATITDADSADFNGGQLTIQLTHNGLTEDRLTIRNQGTSAGQVGVSGANITYGGVIVGTFNGPVIGGTALVVTFNANSTASIAQAVLRNLTYENTSEDPSTTTRTITAKISDGDGGTSNTVTSYIAPTKVNDAPVITTTASTLSYSENAASQVVDSGVTVTDVDNTNLTGATIRISSGFDIGKDILAFTNQNGITGSWNANSGVMTLSGTATLANYQAALRSITYINTSDNPSTATRTVSFVLTDGALSSIAATRTVTVTAVNDAPVLDNTRTPILDSINEDAGLPVGAVGTWVSSLVDFSSPAGQLDNVADADGEASLGIAITGADATHGTWFYTIDNGTTWNALGTVSKSSARLLAADADTRLYFQPNANYVGTLANAITFHAWDQTSGSNGAVANLSDESVADRFSTVSYNNNDGATNWASAWVETDVDGGGASGGRILVRSVEQDLEIRARSATNNIYREVDLSNASSAILSFDYVNELGGGDVIVVQASSNGGDSYTTLTGGTFSSTLKTGSGTFSLDISSFMASDTRIRFFVSSADKQDRLYVDNVQIISPSLNTGASSAFSLESDTASLTVTSVNDAPVLLGIETDTLAYSENEPAKAITSSLLLSDVDSVTISYATVQFSTGYLQTEDKLSFTNTSNITGTWDASTGTMSLTGVASLADYQAALRLVAYENLSEQATATEGLLTVLFTVNDGTTSSNTVTRDIYITSVNDAPVLDNSGSMTLTSITEDQINNAGNTVAEIIASAGGDRITDVDLNALEGIAIIGLNTGFGKWQYSVDAGATWLDVGVVSNTSALLLRITDSVRFLPQYENGSNPDFTFRAWDQTNGAAGTKVSTISNGGITAFSSETETASILIADINDAPVLDNTRTPVLDSIYEDAGLPVGAVGTLISSLVDFQLPGGQIDNIVDEDIGSLLGVAITGANSTNGSWYYSTDNGSNWSLLGNVSDVNARLLAAEANTRIYFAPNADYSGTIVDAIVFRAWDQSTGSNGNLADTSINGGTSAFSSATDTASITILFVNGIDEQPRDLVAIPALGDADIIGYYAFTSSAALGRDDAGDDAPMTLYGSPTQTTGPNGSVALDLAGGASGQYGDIVGISTGGPMTIAGWARFDTTTDWARIVDFGQAYSTGIGNIYVGREHNSNNLTFTIEQDGSYTYRATAVDAITNGAWMHFAATVDNAGNMVLYVNGVQAAIQIGVAPIVGVRDNNYIGKSHWAGDGAFDGAIDDLLIANGALSAAEVQNLYAQSNNFTVTENAANGTVLGTLLVNHPVAGTTYTYTLTDSAEGRFAIDAATGQLSVADQSRLDFESATSHYLTAQITDSLGNTYSEVLTILVANLGGEPSQTIPLTTQNVNEDGSLVFNTVGGNAIKIGDTLSTSNTPLQVYLQVNNGTLTLSQTTGLSIPGGANGSSFMTIQGTESDINAALEGLTYTPTSDYNGSDTLIVTTSLSTNLEGHYTFEGGNAVDQSFGVSQNGTLVGNATTMIDLERGEVLSLDGNRDYVEITGLIGNPANVTIAAWVNLNAAGTIGSEVISLGDSFALRLDEPSAGLIAFIYDGSDHPNVYRNDIKLAETGWQHVAATFDDVTGTLSIYLNGNLVASRSGLNPISYGGMGSNIFIGSHGNGSPDFDFNGLIDDARVYTRALSADEIAALATDQTSVTGTVEIEVNSVNDAPVQSSIEGTALVYTENEGAKAITSTLSINDVDDTHIESAVVAITGNYANGQDLLSFTDQNGIIGSWNSNTGELTLTGSASLAQYETALRSITYTNTSDNPSIAARIVTFTVNDGELNSIMQTRGIEITAVNDAPSGTDNTITVTEDTIYSFTLADFGFSDEENHGLLRVHITTLPTQGTLKYLGTAFSAGNFISLASLQNGEFTYTPSANAEGNNLTSFTFQIQDDGGTANVGMDTDPSPNTITVNVSAVNDAPIFATLKLTISEGASVVLSASNIKTIDYDNSAAELIYSASAITNGRFEYVANPNVAITSFSQADINNGLVKFVHDGSESAPNFQLIVTDGSLNGGPYSPLMNFTKVNDAPVLNLTDNAFTYMENASHVRIGSSATLTDADSSDFAGGTLTATLSDNGTAEDRIFLVNQGTGPGQIEVVGSDVFIDGNLVATTAGGVGAGDPLVVAFTVNADAYAVEAVINRVSFRTSSENPSSLQRTVQMVVTDGEGGTSNTDSVLVNVTPVNDAPVITGASLTLNEGQTVTLTGANFSITDPDDTSFTFTVSSVTGGYFQLSSNAGVSVGSFNSSDLDSGLVQFVDDGNEVAPSFSITVNDGVLDSNSVAATINYTAVNDAPMLNPYAPVYNLTEDSATVTVTASTVLGSSVSDSDAITDSGLAITAINGTVGIIEYSIDGGATWINVGTVSETNALLLRSTDLLRFTPNSQNGGTVITTHRAWDQTSGMVGTKVDVSVNGGATAFSAASDDLTINITSINDAPVLDNTGTMTLTTISEDQTNNSGNTVTEILASAGGDRLTDVDNDSEEGIAITSLSSGNGLWQYSLDGGSNWLAVGTVANDSALLLNDTDRIRLVPNTENGTSASFTFRGWDQTGGLSGEKVDASNNGVTSAFSNATESASILVSFVNDAPTIDTALFPIGTTDEDTVSAVMTANTLLSRANFYDVDFGAAPGIAITAVTGNGTWQYSLDVNNWTDFSAVSASNALLLDGTDLIRYVPDAIAGETATLSFRAWDQITGVASLPGAPSYADPGTGGGTTSFSIATAIAEMTVSDVNDRPVISIKEGDSAGETLLEANAGLSASGTLSVEDVDVSDTVTASVTSVIASGTTDGLSSNAGALLSMLSANFLVIDGTTTVGTVNWSFDSGSEAFNFLATGETLILTYTVSVTDDDGSPLSDTENVTVTITGTNDLPAITVEAGDSAAETLAETNTTLTSSGTLTVSDADLTDLVSSSVIGVAASGTTAGLSSNTSALLAMLTSTANVLDASELTDKLTWNFNSGSEAFDYLAVGETLTLTYTITATDSMGATDTQEVTITITGTNDAPVITVDTGDSEGETLSVTGATLLADGTLSVGDLDRTDEVIAAITSFSKIGDLTGLTLSDAQLEAMLALNASVIGNTQQAGTINWSFNSDTYSFGYLGANESITLVYTVTVTDAQNATDSQDITIVIDGDNSAPDITVAAGDSDTETLAETDTAISTSGTLSVTDINTTDEVTSAVTQVITGGTTTGLQADNAALLNMLSVNASVITDTSETGSITWSFNSGSEAFDYLAVGESLVLTYTITATDSVGATDTQEVTITIFGTNDAAVISGDISQTAAETDAPLTLSGTVSATDVDNADNSFTAQTNVAGTYGTFSIAANGQWTFVANSAFNELNVGDSYVDTFTVQSVDGTAQVVTVTITGTNDAAVISGDISETAAETDAALTLGGTLTARDVDNTDNSFTAQTNVAGTYGTFSIAANGAWSFEANSAFNELSVGDSVTDTFTVQSVDGTVQVVTVTITGTNDAAVISGDISETAAETDAPLTLTGTLTATDVDNADNSFTAQTNVAGTYGTFSIAANGAWTFVANSAFDELNVGDSVTDTFSVQSIDGTAQVVTVIINGANDAAVISGDTEIMAAETDAALTLSGQLSASDVDNTDNSFIAQTDWVGTHGTFNVDASGAWMFVANNAFNELNVGESVTENFIVQSIDGTAQMVTVTINGTNVAPVATVDSLNTEENTLLNSRVPPAIDIDGTIASYALISDVGSGNGSLSFKEDGRYSFNPGSDFDYLAVGQSKVVTFTYTATDNNGAVSLPATVTIIVTGSYDAPVLSGLFNGNVYKNANLFSQGTLSITDVDFSISPVSFPDLAPTFSAQGYGIFSLSQGQWTYQLNNNHPSVKALNSGEFLFDTINFVATDGSTQVVSIVIHGVDDNQTQPWNPLYEANRDNQAISVDVNSLFVSNVQADNQTFISSTNDADPEQQSEVITDLNAYVDRLINELNSVDHILDNPIDVSPVDAGHSQSQRQGTGRFAHHITNIKDTTQNTPFSSDLNLSSASDYHIDSDNVLSDTEEKAFWDRLDHIRQQMDNSEAVEDAKPVNVQVMLGTSVSLTAGFVSWILRGGSLLASFMSTVPLLKRFDPLPVLKSSAKQVQINDNDHKKADEVSFESEINEELEVEQSKDTESR